MSKPTLLYASPFPPMESGISDYSVKLVEALAQKFDITLYSDNYDIDCKELMAFPVVKHGVDNIEFDKYDYVLYNMGNSHEYHSYIYEEAIKHPGVVIQHDFVIFHFICGYYRDTKKIIYSTLYSKFGLDAFTTFKNAVKDEGFTIDLASKLPLNDEILKSGNRFICHSNYSRDKIIETGYVKPENIGKINHIALLDEDEKYIPKEELYKKFGICENDLLIISLGNIVPTKKNDLICKVIKEISKKIDKKICYVMVGRGDCADEYLEDGLIYKTGYTELDEFNSFAKYADIIVNLRFPTLGETSGVILRCLQMGKPIITNNGGWFSELSEDIVSKIELDNIEKNLSDKLLELVSDDEARLTLGKNAMEYIENECSKNVIAEKMYKFITGE